VKVVGKKNGPEFGLAALGPIQRVSSERPIASMTSIANWIAAL
jgi:hypothetical protein